MSKYNNENCLSIQSNSIWTIDFLLPMPNADLKISALLSSKIVLNQADVSYCGFLLFGNKIIHNDRGLCGLGVRCLWAWIPPEVAWVFFLVNPPTINSPLSRGIKCPCALASTLKIPWPLEIIKKNRPDGAARIKF